jgi:hypothetical protein
MALLCGSLASHSPPHAVHQNCARKPQIRHRVRHPPSSPPATPLTDLLCSYQEVFDHQRFSPDEYTVSQVMASRVCLLRR